MAAGVIHHGPLGGRLALGRDFAGLLRRGQVVSPGIRCFDCVSEATMRRRLALVTAT